MPDAVTTVPDRPSPEEVLGRVRRVVAERRTWALAATFVVLVVAQRISVDDPSGTLAWVGFAGVPLVCLPLTLALLRRDGHHLAAGALLVAVSPTVLTSFAAGERHGALAATMACLVALAAAWRLPTLAASSAVAAVVAVVLWWGSGVSRGAAPAPAWSEIAGSTGATVRSGLGVVGAADLPVPPATFLGWWCAVGIVVGAAVLGGRTWTAISVPAAVGAFVVVAWLITWQRGPVDAAGGTWLVAVAVAPVGAAAVLREREAVRVARLLVLMAAAVWAAALVRLYRSAEASPVAVIVVAVAAGVVALLVWPAATDAKRTAGRADPAADLPA